MDFAVMKQPDGALQTCLLEVNDGYSLGVYPGISGKDYTDLLISRRWIFLIVNPTTC